MHAKYFHVPFPLSFFFFQFHLKYSIIDSLKIRHFWFFSKARFFRTRRFGSKQITNVYRFAHLQLADCELSRSSCCGASLIAFTSPKFFVNRNPLRLLRSLFVSSFISRFFLVVEVSRLSRDNAGY